MAGNRRGIGRGLYYFSRGQLAVLGAGFTIASVVVFFLGILIGQRIEEGKLLKREEPLVKIPVKSLVRGSKTGARSKEEMTFYDTLAKAPPRRSVKEVKPPSKAVKSTLKETKTAAKETTAVPPRKLQGNTKTQTQERVWSVQVNAYPHGRDAKNLVKKLKNKGYPAYVVPITIRGRTWHRVRVGRLATREQAEKLQKTLKRKENFTKSFTTSQ